MLNTATPVPTEAIKRELGAAKSWAMFHPNAWIIATELSAKNWYDRIRPVLPENGKLLLVNADMADHKGWVANSIAEWVRRDHSAQDGL